MGQQKNPEEIKENYLKAFPEETGKLAYYLSNQITFLHIKWKEYREIYGSDPETVEMVNKVAPYFFWMYERILRNDVISTIARILDPAYSGGNKPNASLDKLINDLKDHANNSLIEEWEDDLQMLKKTSKKLRNIRNKRLSHNDFDVHVTHSPDILAGISRQNIEDVLEGIRSLTNKIQLHFKNSRTMYDYVFSPFEGTKALLSFIESNLEK